MHCIFCHKDSYSSRSVEHIIPESLGNKSMFLPHGYVCDECNHYFAIKIEKEILSQPYFISLRSRTEIYSKKNKLVKQSIRFPDVSLNSDVQIQTSSGLTILLEDECIYNKIESGEIKTIEIPYIQEPEYPNKEMSRFLSKCAYEYFLYNMGRDKYDLCVQELLGKENDVLKLLREYARFDKGDYWQYSQRRVNSEGGIVYRDDNDCEVLYEMGFFIKEHNFISKDIIESEIYFVMIIAGIEYAICISDQNISEYLKWIAKNENISPIRKGENSDYFLFDLSNINPLLISHKSPKNK